MRISSNAILATLVAIAFILASFVVGIIIVGVDSTSTPLVVMSWGK